MSLAVAAAASGLIGLSLAHAADPEINVAASAGDLATAAAASGGAFSVAGDVIAVASGPVRITGSSTTRRIAIAGGTEASPVQVTLAGLSLTSGSAGAAISLTGTSAARLALDGSSTLTGNATQAGLGVPTGTAVVVEAASGAATAQLTATASGQAAAIGGDGNAAVVNSARGNPLLSGVTAASCGKFTLNSGNVVATSSGLGAAIGGGGFGDGCAVTVNGGAITARATGAGAGIGGGAGAPGISDYTNDSPGGSAKPTVINGGTVTAEAAKSAPIGGGNGGEAVGPTFEGTDGAVSTLTVKAGSLKLTPDDNSRSTSAVMTGGTSGSQRVAVARVPAANLQSVKVGGVDFKVSANHPSDSNIYLYLPHASSGTEAYTVEVVTATGSTNYSVRYRASGTPIVAAVSRTLTLTAPIFTAVTAPYTRPAAKTLSLVNTGTETVQVSNIASSNPAFVLAGATNLSIVASATNTSVTVQPAAGLAVGTHTATITATYDGTSATTATATVSFEVKAGNPTDPPTTSTPTPTTSTPTSTPTKPTASAPAGPSTSTSPPPNPTASTPTGPSLPGSTASAPGPVVTTTAPVPPNASTAGQGTSPTKLLPLKFTKPKLKGTAKVGKKLKVVKGKWTKGTKFSYKWYSNGKLIKKANKSSYKLTAKDRGKKITVKITGTKSGYLPKTVKSKATKVAK